jgi:hypothetical protein
MKDQNGPTPGDQSKLDQQTALVADTMAPFWRRLYDNLLGTGFDDRQAMLLVQTQIISTNPNGIRPTEK